MHVMIDSVIIIGVTLYKDIIMNGISFWTENNIKIAVQSM